MSNSKFLFDSPILSHLLEESTVSPMTELTNNLGGATLGSARRKLSLSNIEESPAVSPMKISPVPENRLLKNALKFTNCNTPVGSGGMKRGIPRRLTVGDRDENSPPSSSFSPLKTSPSKFAAVRQVANIRSRVPLEDHDPNSQDSGFCFSDDSKSSSSTSFRFVEPSGLAPRRSNTESPRRNLAFHSTSSNESLDDGFIEFMPTLQDGEEAQLPPGMGGLISAPIINPTLSLTSSTERCTSFRRSISENLSFSTDILSSGKRPAQDEPSQSPHSKRHKPLNPVPDNIITPRRGTLFEYGFKKTVSPPIAEKAVKTKLTHSVSLDISGTPKRHTLKYSYSESEAIIKNALSRSTQENLIGDFTLPFALPLMNGSHQDLKCISPDTLARLINGEFDDIIETFQIIDCRYPYEYDGGHIKGAVNLFTKDQIVKGFVEQKMSKSENEKRNILIFHCEFSSERGPTLSRFLRQRDRTVHANEYPTLAYPEIYLLNGGYKAFYLSHKELCEPCAYRKMVDVDKEELQHFRQKSKTWSGDSKVRPTKRSTSFMRLGL